MCDRRKAEGGNSGFAEMRAGSSSLLKKARAMRGVTPALSARRRPFASPPWESGEPIAVTAAIARNWSHSLRQFGPGAPRIQSTFGRSG
jgi:hypothetical protein